MDDIFKDATDSESESSEQNLGQSTAKLQKINIQKCNTYRCKKCHPNSPILTKAEIKEINERIKRRAKPRQLKYCSKHCEQCKAFIQRANYYIEQEIIEYCISSNKENDSKNQENKQPIETNQIKEQNNKSNLSLADNNISISENFNLIQIKADGNCLYRAVLECLELDQNDHPTLREFTARLIQERNWNPDQLTAFNVDSGKELADKIRQNCSFSGEEALIPIAEYLNITVAIYMKDRGKTWIKLNNKEENETIYLEFTQGKYADKDHEGHYNTLQPYRQHPSNAKLKAKKILKEMKDNKLEKTLKQNNPKINNNNSNKINILIWNTQGLNNYTKRLYLTNLLYEHNIHIALLQETHYQTNEKMYIKGYKIFRSDGQNHRKGVATLLATNLQCDKYSIYKDEFGRFLKTKIKTQEGKETTIANIYIEPTMREHI